MSTYETDMGNAIHDMLIAARRYAKAYQREFNAPVGNDGVLGDEGMRDILRGLNTLLNGPLGRCDGGELSVLIYKAAHEIGLADENGEF